ncbi:hypothetical protein PPTG_09741 [Phytophthora nicotianae INRA-310]|uniref:Uncharacterized protein n=1 Tax=Phytophthora nicotianae (strain INRA-310) TaxID=761204 RepID=W2QCM3_PHYN3|nr:hypothetical protein PPTG_09741 [Phytophthora nicotianae INRA-310]ETN10626.1 hypothetical protein PPTG_09741 [Phytophthora nicotianae INRA-310]
MSVSVLRAENQSLRRELRAASRNVERLTAIIERRDRDIANLITAHHTEKMFLLNNLEARMTELMRLHPELVGQINGQENRVTMAPAEENKVHGFALTINPMQEEGAHEIRFIAGQEKYVTRAAAGAAGLLFEFTETGNPIDLRQNFKRKANARLQARVGAYLRNHPDEVAPDIVFRCCRSKWVVNTPFPLQEVADILTELLEETNMAMHLAELYTEIHSQLQDYIRIQRFSLVP